MRLKHPKDHLPVIGALAGVGILVMVVFFTILHPLWEKSSLGEEISHGKARDVTLVFYHSRTDKKNHLKVRVDKTLSVYNQIENVVEMLVREDEKKHTKTFWPIRMDIRSIYLRKNGLLILDFEKTVQYNQPVDALGEYNLIRSIIATVKGAFDDIEKVKFLVGGQEVDTLAGHVDITRPFDGAMKNTD